MEIKSNSCKNCKYLKEKKVAEDSVLYSCSKSDSYPLTYGLLDECGSEFRKCYKKRGILWKKH